MDITTFRTVLPEFANSTTYPDAAITYWLAQGALLLLASVWGTTLDQGLLYYTAHNLAIGQRNLRAANAGGVPGEVKGATASKGVDKVNVAYDTQNTQFVKAGLFNTTTYGLEFIRLARLVGIQGIRQIGGCAGPGVNTGPFGDGWVD